MSTTVLDIPLDLIDPGPNVRTQIHDDEDAELAASIERHGVLQPIRVRRRGDRFRVVAGSRRYNASLIAGVRTIPAVILDWGRVAPKTAASIATIPIPAIAVDALRAHQLRQAAARKASWRFWGLVFTTAKGEPIHGNVVLTAWYRALAKAGLPQIHLHDARHTCASILMAAGLDMDVIQKILRHSNSRMTKHYAHVLPSLSREAADHMDRALGAR